jgi:hypothetical protein
MIRGWKLATWIIDASLTGDGEPTPATLWLDVASALGCWTLSGYICVVGGGSVWRRAGGCQPPPAPPHGRVDVCRHREVRSGRPRHDHVRRPRNQRDGRFPAARFLPAPFLEDFALVAAAFLVAVFLYSLLTHGLLADGSLWRPITR